MAPSTTEPEPVVETKIDNINGTTPSKVDLAHEEHQYLDLIREILETGEHRPDRYVAPIQFKMTQL